VAKESGNAKDSLKYMFTEEALREMSAHSFNALPGRRVEKGENWSRISRTDMGPMGRTVTTYEYVHAGKDGKFEKFEVAAADTKYHLPTPGMGDTLPFVVKKMDLKTKKANAPSFRCCSRSGRSVRVHDRDGRQPVDRHRRTGHGPRAVAEAEDDRADDRQQSVGEVSLCPPAGTGLLSLQTKQPCFVR
jgi:hypothetical protein